MKKNITINLCGRLFQIDEDAYELLQQYVESLRQSFGRQEGGDEIVDDIETRIAELFDELLEQGTVAITIDHVKDIITRIGQPEQLAGDDEGNDGGSGRDSARDNDQRFGHGDAKGQSVFDKLRARTAGKRLYRNPDDKLLAGVLSGFAAYTGTDTTWWRIGYVLLFLGSNFFLFPILKLFHFGGFFFHANLTLVLLYIVLAIAMPVATTPKQTLQMKGKPVTPQNIADVVVEEKTPKRHSLVHSILSVLMKVVVGLFVGLMTVFGLALLVCLLMVIVSLAIIFTVPGSEQFGLPFSLDELGLREIYSDHPWVVVAFTLGLVLVLFIPVYAIIHSLLTRTGKVQPMGIGQRIAWIVFWVAALCCFVPSLAWIQQFTSKRYTASYIESHTFQGVVMNDADLDFFRRGVWKLLKHENCDHYTWSGDYPDKYNVRYLDTYNYACEAVYQVERKQAVEPGIYRLDCIARAEGPGTFVYAIGDGKHIKEIPGYGDEGGELGKGHGWSPVAIDSIVVTTDSIAYGLSSDAAFTGHSCRARWFSATDFVVTRIGDL